MADRYRRRSGVIYRRGTTWSTGKWPILDGGEDAPLSPRGKRNFRLLIGGLIVLGLVSLVVIRFA